MLVCASAGGRDLPHAGLSVGGTDVGDVGDVLEDDVVDVGEDVVVVTGAPVHAVPLRVNEVGAGLLPLHEPLKPNVAVAPVARLALWLTPRAVTWAPLCVAVAFHAWVTCWPEAKLQVSVQELIGSPRFVTATFAVKPLFHCDGTE
ncbi:hypothetical protein ADK67_27270 [Saccharothrix sp. NRRL B-16348]|nr:hypothetical protein ADK67_27270 [Saccharothrix sp. NRRL B-16348]